MDFGLLDIRHVEIIDDCRAVRYAVFAECICEAVRTSEVL